ncbi:MAG: hypothetical protein MSJ26_03580 [Oscillospiraceae bacterium]|nr:hypothetical protein [Oscillospiraceae bacterium]
MKKIRLITAVITALSAVTAFSAAASAADVIDFENGKYSFVSMKTDDGGDDSVLSVVDFNGSKQLKVEVTDCKNVPKVCFDLNSILKKRDFEKVKTIEMDITIESKDGTTPPGWAGGAIGTQGGSNSPAWSQTPWELEENKKAVTDQTTICKKFLLYSDRLVNGTPDTQMILMRWGAEVDYNMYVDNIRFFDSDGKALKLSLRASSPKQTSETEEESETEAVTETETEAVTEAATEPVPETEPVTETETEPAAEEESEHETEAVTEAETEEILPESDNDTTSSTTGNVSAFAAASAVVLSGYAVAMTRRKKKQS